MSTLSRSPVRHTSLSRLPEPVGVAADSDVGDPPAIDPMLVNNDHEFQPGATGSQPLVNDRTHEDIFSDLLVQGEDEEAETSIALPRLQMTQAFMDLLHVATLNDSGMDSDDILTLHNPEAGIAGYDLVNPSQLLRSLQHFINNASASCDHYDGIQEIEQHHNLKDVLLSFDQVKHCIQWLSGIVPIECNMCPKSCVAYTGLYSELNSCPHCSTPHYLPGDTKKAQQTFATIPIGPVIQALYGSHNIADQMHYLERRLAQNADCVQTHSKLPSYDNTACGQELLDAWNLGTFG